MSGPSENNTESGTLDVKYLTARVVRVEKAQKVNQIVRTNSIQPLARFDSSDSDFEPTNNKGNPSRAHPPVAGYCHKCLGFCAYVKPESPDKNESSKGSLRRWLMGCSNTRPGDRYLLLDPAYQRLREKNFVKDIFVKLNPIPRDVKKEYAKRALRRMSLD